MTVPKAESKAPEAPPAALIDAEPTAEPVDVEKESHTQALKLVCDDPLYTTILTDSDVGFLVSSRLREANIGNFDYYCIECKRETPFVIRSRLVKSAGGGMMPGQTLDYKLLPDVFGVVAVCQRSSHVYNYVFRETDQRLVKIGQLPSMADIAFGELRHIDASLNDADRKELGTALGLFGHGAALGGFAYLRRVFERMIDRAHQRKIDSGGEVQGFDAMKMHEKIAALKTELPSRVVANSKVFSILSLGLHELTEEKCTVIFPLMKAMIFQMLEQEEHKRNADKAARETEAQLSKLLSSGFESEA